MTDPTTSRERPSSHYPDREQSGRRPLGSDEILCFLHIPKTAGLSLRPLLDNNFSLREVCPADSYASLGQLAREAPWPYRLLRGHFWHNIGERLPMPAVYMTMLRDPIERTLSQYHYVKRAPSNGPLHEIVKRMTLEEYLYDEFLCEQTVRDLQTRYLAPASQPAGDFEVAPDAHLGLDQAKANLEALAFLGTTERFADSVRLLSYTFQWRPISAFETLNVSDQRTSQKQLSPRLVDRIRELNENDLRLYDFATHLFESRLGRMTDQLLWESYARPAQAGPSSVRLSADEYWDGDGWHFPELDAEGRPYRWMARTHAVVDVAVSAESDKLLRVRVMNYVSVDVFATLRIAVNGVSVAVIFEQIDNQIITSALIPRAALRSRRPYARIEFSISETRQPPPVEGEAPDERKLGLAFGWLELGPAC